MQSSAPTSLLAKAKVGGIAEMIDPQLEATTTERKRARKASSSGSSSTSARASSGSSSTTGSSGEEQTIAKRHKTKRAKKTATVSKSKKQKKVHKKTERRSKKAVRTESSGEVVSSFASTVQLLPASARTIIEAGQEPMATEFCGVVRNDDGTLLTTLKKLLQAWYATSAPELREALEQLQKMGASVMTVWLQRALKSVYYRSCLTCHKATANIREIPVDIIGPQYLLLCGECCEAELMSEKKLRAALPVMAGKSVGTLPNIRVGVTGPNKQSTAYIYSMAGDVFGEFGPASGQTSPRPRVAPSSLLRSTVCGKATPETRSTASSKGRTKTRKVDPEIVAMRPQTREQIFRSIGPVDTHYLKRVLDCLGERAETFFTEKIVDLCSGFKYHQYPTSSSKFAQIYEVCTEISRRFQVLCEYLRQNEVSLVEIFLLDAARSCLAARTKMCKELGNFILMNKNGVDSDMEECKAIMAPVMTILRCIHSSIGTIFEAAAEAEAAEVVPNLVIGACCNVTVVKHLREKFEQMHTTENLYVNETKNVRDDITVAKAIKEMQEAEEMQLRPTTSVVPLSVPESKDDNMSPSSQSSSYSCSEGQ